MAFTALFVDIKTLTEVTRKITALAAFKQKKSGVDGV